MICLDLFCLIAVGSGEIVDEEIMLEQVDMAILIPLMLASSSRP